MKIQCPVILHPMGLETKIKRMPGNPGVYLIKDAGGRVLYIGKAKNLRVRVRSYLRPQGDGRAHVRLLMARAKDIDWVITESEKEALILENNLIKKHRPRYNVDLKDDKSYLTLKITTREEFPRLEATRRINHDGSLYFGPYSSARDLRATVELINRIFPLRRCSNRDFKLRTRPCLYHKTSGCKAPCVGMIGVAEYQAMVDEVILFLGGKSGKLLNRLGEEMKRASTEHRFEDAGLTRDRIRAVKLTLEKQQTQSMNPIDRDVIGWVREGAEAQAAVLIVRSGAVLDQRGYYMDHLVDDEAGVVAEFIRRYYREDRIVPAEIIIPCDLGEEEELTQRWLSEKRGKKVRLINPKRGEKVAILRMATENAQTLLTERRKSKVGYEKALEELRDRLGLASVPARMECFDVSNTQGALPTASMVVFTDGFPDKSAYKRFAIKTVKDSDDYAMLREAMTRRFARTGPGWEKPDLLVVDGGKGQLSAALAALEDMGVTIPAVIGLAKARTIPGTAEPLKSAERIFVPGRKNPIIPPRNSSAIFLLQRLRDEAHRFAIAYHRKRRGARISASKLDGIPGVGDKRKKALLRKFGSIKGIIKATSAELAQATGISEKLAVEILDHLNTNSE